MDVQLISGRIADGSQFPWLAVWARVTGCFVLIDLGASERVKKITIVLLVMMFGAASMAEADVANVPWDEAHIKTLRAADKSEVVHFFLKQTDPEENFSESDLPVFDFDWYPAGDGKYELVIGYSYGPDISSTLVFWQDRPGKFHSQGFGAAAVNGYDWYPGPYMADLDKDGRTELINQEGLDVRPGGGHRDSHGSRPRKNFVQGKSIPHVEWPAVYRLQNGKYVEASPEFPGFYDETVLPLISKAMDEKRNEMATRAAEKKKHAPFFAGDEDEYFEEPSRYLAALIMCKDKILRVLGRDPNAGLAQAREWLTSSDPVLVDDARMVSRILPGTSKTLSRRKTQQCVRRNHGRKCIHRNHLIQNIVRQVHNPLAKLIQKWPTKRRRLPIEDSRRFASHSCEVYFTSVINFTPEGRAGSCETAGVAACPFAAGTRVAPLPGSTLMIAIMP
jgi:hypothetical protein